MLISFAVMTSPLNGLPEADGPLSCIEAGFVLKLFEDNLTQEGLTHDRIP